MRRTAVYVLVFSALICVIAVGCQGQQTASAPAVEKEEKATPPVAERLAPPAAAKPAPAEEEEEEKEKTAEGPSTKKLLADLKNESVSVWTDAADLLAQRGDKRGLLALTEGASTARGEPRERCISVLHGLSSDIGSGKSPKIALSAADEAPLLVLLDSADEQERGWVIRLLGATGGTGAASALFARLPKEQDIKNKRRICTSLAHLRYRPAAAEMVKLLEKGLGSGEKDYNWAIAASWAEISDPATVPAMITLLGNAERASCAAYGLSRAFGPAVKDDIVPLESPMAILVPGAEGALEQKATSAAPRGDELKKLWEGFWAKNSARYDWNAKTPSLRSPK